MENFIKHSKVSPAIMKSRLMHPITNEPYPHRFVFDKLQKYSQDFFNEGAEPRMISLAGLRGVGKTTLLWQMADYLYFHHTEEVYFFNVNTIRSLGSTLLETLDLFQEKILHQRFIERTTPLVLLFDEVHDDEDWAKTLKILYDEARWCFILATGSSALFLNTTADLARRMYIEKIYPFSFTEFAIAKTNASKNTIFPIENLRDKMHAALFYSKTADESIEVLHTMKNSVYEYWEKIELATAHNANEWINQYINYHNIPGFLRYKDSSLINDSIIELLKRVIQEDIPKFSKINLSTGNIDKILYRLAGSDEINTDTLSTSFGIKREEVTEIIEILQKAELINVLFPFGGIDSKLNKSRKAFFMSPSLRCALLSVLYGSEVLENHNSKLLEDLIVLYLKRLLPDTVLSYSSLNKSVNPDFIIETRDKPILIETGLNKKSSKQVAKSGIDYRYGIIISFQNKELSKQDHTIHLPLQWFLLL